MNTKKFSLKQLFAIVDGRMSTSMSDIYEILNHVCDENLYTHHLPLAKNYVLLKNPKWVQQVKELLEEIGKPIGAAIFTPDFVSKNIEFSRFMEAIENNNPMIEVPQLKDEFDTSDFVDYMINNSLLLKK